MGWPAAVKEIIAAMRKLAAPLFAFFFGRASARRGEEKRARKALERELEASHEEDRLLADDAELRRMRDRWRGTEDGNQ